MKNSIIDLNLSPVECRLYHEAIADVICWMSGYKAAGGVIDYVNLSRIEELKTKLQEKMA
jgi:hypothetical protein